jgi:predicted transcriptional regulator
MTEKITTIRLEAEMVKIIDKWAAQDERSRSYVIRKILEAEIERRQAKPTNRQAPYTTN